MKFNILTLAISLSALHFVSPSFAGGPDIIYGGDPIIETFQAYQQEVIRDLQTVPVALLPEPQFLEEYKAKVSETVVRISNAPLFKDSDEYMFLNYPSLQPPQILISRSLWLQTPLTPAKYKKFVLHETLHLLGYDDSKYGYSTRLASFIDFFRSPLHPYSLIQSTVDDPSPDTLHAALWTLSHLSEVISPLSPTLSDDDLASLVAFAGRSPLLYRSSLEDRTLITNNIVTFLGFYTYFSTYPSMNSNQYECTLIELDKYRETILSLNEVVQHLSWRGYSKPRLSPATKECSLPL